MLRQAICVLRCKDGHQHGVVYMKEIKRNGPIRFRVYIEGLENGKHGFHVHRLGNEFQGSHSLCDHFNPTDQDHGARNSPYAHAGDLGNITSRNGYVDTSFIAKYVRLSGPFSIYGRSLVVHSDQDDLGKGGDPESLKTGNSGKRVLWGIIGVNDDSEC